MKCESNKRQSYSNQSCFFAVMNGEKQLNDMKKAVFLVSKARLDYKDKTKTKHERRKQTGKTF